jgi:hypothetical protein
MADVISTPTRLVSAPEPGSAEELRRFAALQEKLEPLARRVLSDPRARQTVVVIPSLTLDVEELAKIPGAHHYEERLLCMLMLLRLPRTHVVYVTSQHIARAIVDYYLHLLPGVPVRHARSRLTLLSCHDASDVPLTRKILDRPRVVERIRSAIADPEAAHLTCFNSTPLERSLAVRLGIPLYGNDPELNYLGTKSGSREAFREAGVPLPEGFEHLRDGDDVIEAVLNCGARRSNSTRVSRARGTHSSHTTARPTEGTSRAGSGTSCRGASGSNPRARPGSVTGGSSKRWVASSSAGWRGRRCALLPCSAVSTP